MPIGCPCGDTETATCYMHNLTLTCNNYFNVSYVLGMTFILMSYPYLIYMSKKKEKQIMHKINNKTYCIISIWILHMTIINLVLSIIYSTIFLVDIYLRTYHYFVTVNNVSLLHLSQFIFGGFIRLSQCYEWYNMNSIINFQQNKSYGEVLFEIQNSELFLKYRKREKTLNILYFSIGIIMFTFNLGLVIYVLSISDPSNLFYWTRFNSWSGYGGLVHVLMQICFSILMIVMMAILLKTLKKYHV